MNLDQLAASAFRRAPASARGRITFTNPKTGAEASAEATGVPGRGTQQDGFRDGVTIQEKHRRLSVLAQELTFTPRAGQYATWEGTRWNVIGATPVRPSGGIVFLYRVTLAR